MKCRRCRRVSSRSSRPRRTRRRSRADGRKRSKSMKPSRFGGERGAITIHVAIVLIAMLTFVSFVADYGLMWVSRRQAQNAADAAALAGAIALTYEGGTAAAKRSAAQLMSENYIFGTPTSAANFDIDV